MLTHDLLADVDGHEPQAYIGVDDKITNTLQN